MNSLVLLLLLCSASALAGRSLRQSGQTALEPTGAVASDVSFAPTADFFGTIQPGAGMPSAGSTPEIALCGLGDVNGDGFPDMGLGLAGLADGSKSGAGAMFVSFLNGEYEPQSPVQVEALASTANAKFGSSCAGLGDLDQDKVRDMAVGEPGSDSVSIVLLKREGTAKTVLPLAPGSGGLSSDLVPSGSKFGTSMAPLGRFFSGAAKDGMSDLAVGAPMHERVGAVHLLQLSTSGGVRQHTVITAGTLNFAGTLASNGLFGSSVTYLGDIDGDGVGDIAVGAPKAQGYGVLYVIRLTREGGVKGFTQITSGSPGFEFKLSAGRQFGGSCAGVGDVDGDGVPDLVVGSPWENSASGMPLAGVGFLLLLNAEGGVKSAVRLPRPTSSSQVFLRAHSAMAALTRLPSNRTVALVTAMPGFNGQKGGVALATVPLSAQAAEDSAPAAATLPFLRDTGVSRDCVLSSWSGWSSCSVPCGDGVRARHRSVVKDSEGQGWHCPSAEDLTQTEPCNMGECLPGSIEFFGMVGPMRGGFGEELEDGVHFGSAVCGVGDVNGDGEDDMVVGAPGAGEEGRGRAFLVTLSHTYVAQNVTVLGHEQGGLKQALPKGAGFGAACAGAGDVNGDGVPDLVVGAPSGEEGGAAYLLLLKRDGTVSNSMQISQALPTVPSKWQSDKAVGFGSAVAGLGPLLGKDEVPDLAVGNPSFDDDKGAVFLMRMKADGHVDAVTVIGSGTEGFLEVLPSGSRFGASVAMLGDVDGDGVGDIAVSAPGADGGKGTVYVIRLTAEGGVSGFEQVREMVDAFDMHVSSAWGFGASVAAVGDVDGDGVPDVAIGTPGLPEIIKDGGGAVVALLRTTGEAKKVATVKPPKELGYTGSELGVSMGVLHQSPRNRTLVLAMGAWGAAFDEMTTGAVALSLLSISDKSDDVGATVIWPLQSPLDCQLSDWSGWTECTEECGGGEQARSRAVVRDAAVGGRACEDFKMVQKRACNVHPCPVDCELGEWGGWGNCSVECGGGLQRRSRPVEVAPAHGGQECNTTSQTRECNLHPCPVDCELGPWGVWGECSAECGGGLQEQNRSVVVAPLHGGAACGNRTRSRVCNVHPCPVPCVTGNWTEWGECDAPCGGGNQTRERDMLEPPLHGAGECVLEESRSCNTQRCPEPCQVSKWSEWGECSEWCGNGTHTRHRTVTREAEPGGAACPALNETRTCKLMDCPVHCEVSEWSKWSECSAECGPGGRRYRSRRVTQPPLHGGDACPPLDESEPCFAKHCPVDCQVGLWGNWSACDPWCGPGTQNRTRPVAVKPQYEGKACPPLVDRRACNARPCPVPCEVSAWRWDGLCTKACGTGKRRRVRHVTVPAEHGGDVCPPLEDYVPCNTHACVQPVTYTEQCGGASECEDCVSNPHCGWSASSKTCLVGEPRGPRPLWSESPFYLEDPMAEFLRMANVKTWEYAYCKGSTCGRYSGCGNCVADPMCGWCETAQACMEGGSRGPTRGGVCPNGWVYARGLVANQTALMPGALEVRVTEPRPAHAYLEAFCEADPAMRTSVYSRILREGGPERPAETCLPCHGKYPYCDCSGVTSVHGLEDVAAVEREVQHAAEEEVERQEAEEVAETAAANVGGAVMVSDDGNGSGEAEQAQPELVVEAGEGSSVFGVASAEQ